MKHAEKNFLRQFKHLMDTEDATRRHYVKYIGALLALTFIDHKLEIYII